MTISQVPPVQLPVCEVVNNRQMVCVSNSQPKAQLLDMPPDPRLAIKLASAVYVYQAANFPFPRSAIRFASQIASSFVTVVHKHCE